MEKSMRTGKQENSGNGRQELIRRLIVEEKQYLKDGDDVRACVCRGKVNILVAESWHSIGE